MIKYPFDFESPDRKGGLIVENSKDLRQHARIILGLSPGFLEECTDKEIVEFFVQRSWWPRER